MKKNEAKADNPLFILLSKFFYYLVNLGFLFPHPLFPLPLCSSLLFKNDAIQFDLDNTLVTYPASPGDYTSCKPMANNIRLVQELKAAGHTIIIYTSRAMSVNGSNVGRVLADVGTVTFDTLRKFEIPFDEVHFGKPHADCYVDNAAVKNSND